MRFILISLFVCIACNMQAADRIRYNFNSDWKLKVGDIVQAEKVGYPDLDWKSVTLPHAFNEDEALNWTLKT